MYKLCGLNSEPGRLATFILILVIESLASTALGMVCVECVHVCVFIVSVFVYVCMYLCIYVCMYMDHFVLYTFCIVPIYTSQPKCYEVPGKWFCILTMCSYFIGSIFI